MNIRALTHAHPRAHTRACTLTRSRARICAQTRTKRTDHTTLSHELLLPRGRGRTQLTHATHRTHARAGARSLARACALIPKHSCRFNERLQISLLHVATQKLQHGVCQFVCAASAPSPRIGKVNT
eukprot:2799561-Pleurochrysis_carterae.AAC.1